MENENNQKIDKNNTLYYNVGSSVEWDVHKAELNLRKHKVSFDEALTVLLSDNTIELEDKSFFERRFLVIGFSLKTRLLTVVCVHRDKNRVRIISARKASKNEARKYEERI